jgi:hypothetical protein
MSSSTFSALQQLGNPGSLTLSKINQCHLYWFPEVVGDLVPGEQITDFLLSSGKKIKQYFFSEKILIKSQCWNNYA